MATKEFTTDEVKEILEDDLWTVVNVWLARGDGVAIYENKELNHPQGGSHQFASFGSKQAMLETDTPPERLPDIGTSINWRYMLIGTYRGEQLKHGT